MEWISVEDRLPEKRTPILAYAKGATMLCSLEIDDNDGEVICMCTVGYSSFEGEFDHEWDEVSHWQYLPQPPKEQTTCMFYKGNKMENNNEYKNLVTEAEMASFNQIVDEAVVESTKEEKIKNDVLFTEFQQKVIEAELRLNGLRQADTTLFYNVKCLVERYIMMYDVIRVCADKLMEDNVNTELILGILRGQIQSHDRGFNNEKIRDWN